MSSDDVRPDEGQGKKETKETKIAQPQKKHKSEKPKITLGWIVGIIVLVLIVASFLFSPILGLINPSATNTDIEFGKYGKERINYAANSYMALQFQNLVAQLSSTQLDQTAQFYLLQDAYVATLKHLALSKMAREVGLSAVPQLVNEWIIESGAYSDENGNFDIALYESTSLEYKTQIEMNFREEMPPAFVKNDVKSVKSSPREIAYVSEMAAASRTFDFVTFDYTYYPDEDAITYGMNDPQQFVSLKISMITFDVLDTANTVMRAIQNEEYSFESGALNNSRDDYRINAGRVGEMAYWKLADNLYDTSVIDTLFTAYKGEDVLIGPYLNPSGQYVVYRVESSPIAPDFTAEAAIASVKSYLTAHEPEIITEYLGTVAADFSADIEQIGFAPAAEKWGLDITSVSQTTYDGASSTFYSELMTLLYDPSETLPEGISSNYDAMKTLFTLPVASYMSAQIDSENYATVLITGDEPYDKKGEMMGMIYNTLASLQNDVDHDLWRAIVTSPLHYENFYDTAIDMLFTTTT